MAKINLRDFYAYYVQDCIVEVTDDVADTMNASIRAEQTYERKLRRYHAYYSLDRDDGIENQIVTTSCPPNEICEQKWISEQLYTAIAMLPDVQAERIRAYFLLGMSLSEIAREQGVSHQAIKQSIQCGLQRMERNLKNML